MPNPTPTVSVTRQCFYQETHIAAWRPGIFHTWSVDYDYVGESPAHFPVAIVEDVVTGMCFSVYVKRICFSEVAPS